VTRSFVLSPVEVPRARSTQDATLCLCRLVPRFEDAPDDQDYEWAACFVIDALTITLAQAWGDRLAKDYAVHRDDTEFLSSNVTPEGANDVALLTRSVWEGRLRYRNRVVSAALYPRRSTAVAGRG
jgi:hypothetical protein